MTQSSSRRAEIAVAGAGFISEQHLAALHSLPDVRVAAICDQDINRAVSTQQRWGIAKAYPSLEEMLREGAIDVVHVLLPPPFHFGAALACMEAGCDVFVEKPLATSLAECLDLRRAAARLGRLIGVNHNAVYHPAFQRLVQEIRGCAFGAVQHVFACVNVPLRQLSSGQHGHWMFQAPGNIILEQAPHPLSQIHFLLGRFRDVAAMRSGERLLSTGRCFYDTWQVSLLCERGTAQCFLSFGKEYLDQWLYVIGQDATAMLDLGRNTLSLSGKSRFMNPVDALFNALKGETGLVRQGFGNFADYALPFLRLRAPADPFSSGMRASITAFYEARRRGMPHPVGAEEGVEVVGACEKAAQLVAGGRGWEEVERGEGRS